MVTRQVGAGKSRSIDIIRLFTNILDLVTLSSHLADTRQLVYMAAAALGSTDSASLSLVEQLDLVALQSRTAYFTVCAQAYIRHGNHLLTERKHSVLDCGIEAFMEHERDEEPR